MPTVARKDDRNADGHYLPLGTLQYKTIDGLKIRYAESLVAKGDPILLLSPWPESIYAFLPTWEVFTALGPVIAIDLPGYGHSESRPDIFAPEPMGDFIRKVVDAFKLNQPHVVGPDIVTPSLLYAAANYPGLFKSMIIGGGATDPTDIGDLLAEMVNAPSLESFKDMTGAQFVQGVVDNLKRYDLPEFARADYLASYEGKRFVQSVAFVRQYQHALPRTTARPSAVQDRRVA